MIARTQIAQTRVQPAAPVRSAPKVSVREGLHRLAPHIKHLQQEFKLPVRPTLAQMVKTEWSRVPEPDLSVRTIRPQDINTLYELRAQILDWEVQTGFLGFFTANPGYRYSFTRRLEILFDMLPASLDGMMVAEMGTAAGIVANTLAPYVKQYVGTDVTPTALSFARALSKQLGYTNVEYVVADGHSLPLPDNAFDLVIATETYEHLVNPIAGLREFYRILKPGGIVALTTPTAPTLSDLAMKLVQLVKNDLHVEDTAQFDKKAYFAAQEAGMSVPTATFKRVHYRFGYKNLIRDFADVGFTLTRAKGAVFGFPPYYLATYQLLPAWTLPLIRRGEEALNAAGIFARCGAVTTGFQLVKPA